MADFLFPIDMYVGTHDFRAFANRVEHTYRDYQEKGDYDFSTIRTVNWIKFIDEGDDFYRVDVHLGSAHRLSSTKRISISINISYLEPS